MGEDIDGERRARTVGKDSCEKRREGKKYRCYRMFGLLTYSFWIPDGKREPVMLHHYPSSQNPMCRHLELRSNNILYVKPLANIRHCQTKCLLMCGRHNMPLGVIKLGWFILVCEWQSTVCMFARALFSFPHTRYHIRMLCYCNLPSVIHRTH